MSRKYFYPLFALAVLMRVTIIAQPPLWYDENFTYILARLPFDKMIQATAGDVHPPLWYLIEWGLYHALPMLPAWGVRLPALVFSIAAFWMFAKLGIVLQIEKRVFWGALICMAILPMQVWYAQEGRMYAMLEFLVLTALYLGLTRRWFWFGVSTIALVYTQNYGIIYCAVIAVLVILTDWEESFGAVSAAGGITALAYLPWAVVVTSQMGEINGRYWIMDAGAGAVLGAVYKQFWASAMLPAGTIASYFVTFVLIIFGVIVLLRERTPHWFTILMMVWLPICLAWIISLAWQPILLFRPLIGISPFLYLVVCAPLALLPSETVITRHTIYAASFVVPIAMYGVAGYYLNIANMKGEGAVSPMLDSLDYIAARWQDGDVIYYTDDGPMVNLMPYTVLPQYKMPACDERVGFAPVLGSLSDTTREAFGIPIADLDDIPHRRAWVFAPRSPLHPYCYEDQIAQLAPEGQQLITVDDNQFITSGVWLVENTKAAR